MDRLNALAVARSLLEDVITHPLTDDQAIALARTLIWLADVEHIIKQDRISEMLGE